MRAGSTAVLHSTAPQPRHVLSVGPGNWRTAFFRNLPGCHGEERDCSVVLWYVSLYNRARVCKVSCHLGCNIKKIKKIKGTLCPATAPRCAGTGVQSAVIYNEAAIYCPVFWLFSVSQLREKYLWHPHWAHSSWRYVSWTVNRGVLCISVWLLSSLFGGVVFVWVFLLVGWFCVFSVIIM